ncbi:MAG TPA: 3-deoxy-7-phosphoheptulonate synthase, partial [Pseudonocardiaceae bacterium]|nr:3-deoxy-7-phosphoheptulonate synthase [Pseudonocardiaceae bacterium]
VAGRQDVGPVMTRGQSVTDACLDWDTTSVLLGELADAVRTRRG